MRLADDSYLLPSPCFPNLQNADLHQLAPCGISSLFNRYDPPSDCVLPGSFEESQHKRTCSRSGLWLLCYLPLHYEHMVILQDLLYYPGNGCSCLTGSLPQDTQVHRGKAAWPRRGHVPDGLTHLDGEVPLKTSCRCETKRLFTKDSGAKIL